MESILIDKLVGSVAGVRGLIDGSHLCSLVEVSFRLGWVGQGSLCLFRSLFGMFGLSFSRGNYFIGVRKLIRGQCGC